MFYTQFYVLSNKMYVHFYTYHMKSFSCIIYMNENSVSNTKEKDDYCDYLLKNQNSTGKWTWRNKDSRIKHITDQEVIITTEAGWYSA